MSVKITDTEISELLVFMESPEFSKKFMETVHKISLSLRVDSINTHGAQPSLQKDLASIEERVEWVKVFCQKTLEDRSAKYRAEMQSQQLNRRV